MQSEKTKKTKWALRLVGLFVASLVFITLIFFATKSHNDFMTLKINNVELQTEIATTSQEKSRGLCCRDSLPQNRGMLFVYDSPGDYRFWMKDTLIALDMYWIDANKKIVHIEQNVQPSSYPKTYGTETESRYVLETNAGFAKRHNIKVGDTAAFNL